MAVMAETAVLGTGARRVTLDFSSWMAGEQRRVFLLCLRMLNDPEDADIATQDAFLKAYRALDKTAEMDGEGLAKWLTRIAVNTCLDKLRSRRWRFWRQRPSQEDQAALLEVAVAGAPSAERLVESQQVARRVEAALGRLSDRQRSVFVLKHYEDRSLDEIGQMLGLETGTVKAHMSRALGKLREELRDLYGRPALD